MTRFALGLVIVSMIPGPALATTWEVFPDGSGDAPTIQAAIDSAAASGDTVLVHTGTYQETLHIESYDSLTLIATNGSDRAIVDADAYNRCVAVVNSNVSFERFSFTNGHHENGGGVYQVSSNVEYIECRFENCMANDKGGGISMVHGSVDLSDCVLVNCHAGLRSEFTGHGGGIYRNLSEDLSTLSVENSLFENNSATGGGAVYGPGSFTGCDFIGNQAENAGGLFTNGIASVVNCLFAYNNASRSGGAIVRGYDSPVEISNTTIVENEAAEIGGAIVNATSGSGFSLSRCVIVMNRSPLDIVVSGGPYTAECCVIWNPVGSMLPDELFGIEGNFSLDPLFCDPDNDDFTLAADSPCAPGNHPDGVDCGLIGAFDVGCGSTAGSPDLAVKAVTWGQVKGMFR